MGNCALVEHEIDTGSSRPFKEQLRVHPDSIHQVIDDEVDRMLKLDVIEPCASPWASNVLIVWKADGKPRFCIDFRRLNDKTIKDHYPLPNIQYIYRQVGHSSWFSTVDLESGFWQLLIKPSDRPKTAFITPKGQYQFKRMPLGLCNAPSSFQRMIDQVVSPELRAFLKAYVDDILTHSSTFEDHLKHVDILLKRLISCGLTVKLCKCKFCRRLIKFLGCMISKNKLQADLGKTKVISEWQRLTSIKATRMFLGLANYYRNFIPRFAQHAEPLYTLLRKDAPFVWGRPQEIAFAHIKHALTHAPTLILPDPSREYILRTDASDTAVSAILLQQDLEGNAHPVAYASHTLNSAQRNYTVTEREMLALVWGLQHYRQYLFRKVTWVTDHSALTHLLKPGREPPNQRVARWILSLQDYEIKPLHSPGKSLADADALSRMHDANTPALHSIDASLSAVASIANLQELKAAQLADPICSLISRLVRGEITVDDSLLNSRVRQLYKTHKFVHDSDGVLQMMWEPNSHSRSGPSLTLCTYIPSSLVTQVVSLVHDDKLTGHQGINRTYERIRESAWWPSMVEDIASYVSACGQCQKHKIAGRQSVPLQPMSMPTAPWMQVSIDTVGPLHTTRHGNKYIICMVDYFTRYCEAQAVGEQSTHTVLQAVYKQVICRHGVPQVLISDRGSPYVSEVAKQMFNRLGIKRHYSSAYHPQSNGAVERFNRTLKETLRVWANENADDWDDLLPFALFSYNTAFHSTIKNTPFYLEHARMPRLPLDVQLGRACSFFEDYDSYVYQMSQRIYQTHADVQRIYERISTQRKEAADENNKRLPSYSPGQLVYVRDLTAVHKLYPKWVGPYEVVRKVSDVVYELKINNELKPVNLDRIKAHHSHSSPTIDLAQEIGHFHSLLELSRVEAKQAIECQQRVESRLAELQQQQQQQQQAQQADTQVSDSSVQSTESHTQSDSSQSQSTTELIDSLSTQNSSSVTDTQVSSSAQVGVPSARRPPLRRRGGKVMIPTSSPTYTGLLRSRPSVSYAE